jgi:hypothetical protein
VVPRVRIEKTEGFAPSCRIDYLTYARQRKQILGTCLVKAHLALLVVEAAKALLHWFRSWLDVQLVLDNLSRDPLHVGGFPREHVEVCFEEVDDRAFLFRIERRPDTECTAIVGDGRILDVLGGLERAGCSLGRLGDILVLGWRLSVEPLTG